MIATSVAYKTAVKATVRKWRPRCAIVWTSADLDPTIIVESNNSNYGVPIDGLQVADGTLLATHKWFHLDGICDLSGIYYVAPDDAAAPTHQLGWWGATRCDGSAAWSVPYPYLTVNFTARSILELAVSGDQQYNEYPVDFDIQVYEDAVLVYTEEVRGNTELNYSKSISSEGINAATKMTLILYKWSAANRVAKILEFYTSISATYDGDDIVTMDLLEEREIADGSLPVGNISANEFDLSLQNINIGTLKDPFSYYNSNSYLMNLIKKNRKIIPELGLVLPDDSVEYIQLGTFWSGDWKSSERSTTVSTSCLDRLGLLQNAEFAESEIYSSITAYDLLEIVLNHAKTNMPMSDLTWTIDAELDTADFVFPLAYFERQAYFKCIRQVVEACLGQAYMSRDDILIITGPSFAGNSTSGYEVTKNEYFDKQQPSKSQELKNSIRVPVTSIVAKAESAEMYRSDLAVTLAAGASTTIHVDYSSHPASSVAATLESASAGISITSDDFYACGADIVITNAGGAPGTFILVVTGIAYEKNSDAYVEANDSDSITEFGLLKYDFPENHLIQSVVVATKIATALLASYKTWRKDVNLQWCGDPSLELGDLIVVNEYQRGIVNKKANFLIFKNDLSFDGGLRSITDGRKISDV